MSLATYKDIASSEVYEFDMTSPLKIHSLLLAQVRQFHRR